MKEMRRILALVLCFVMLVGILPVGALATDIVPEETSVVETTEAPTNAAEGDEVANDIQNDDVEDDEVVPAEDAATAAPDAADANAGIALASNEDDGVAPAAEGTSVVVIAGSDYQASGASGTMQTIMKQIKNDCSIAYGALLGGDYDGGDATTTTADIEAVNDDIDAVFPEITAAHRIYLQGNHESWSNLDPSGSNLMNETGAYDTDHYGVYAINHKDYPWYMSNPDASLVQATAADLDEYLDDKAEKEYDKPIFVMSHLPLHYSTRTSSNGDGQYAKYLYDVLDEAGDKGLNIIFLFGHNHSSTYDDYLGGGQIYLEVGDSICVAEEGSKTSYFTDTLSFTYLNYGYVGTIKGKAGNNLSMTSFEIDDDQVIVNRYGTKGTVELKAKGVTTSGAPTADTSTVASGAVIKLNQFEPAAALTGITVTAPAKTAYVVGDTLDTTGMVVTATYDDGSTKDVTGYEVSADLSSAGTKTATVTYKEKTATFEVTVYAPVEDATTGVTVAAPGVTSLTVTKLTEEIPADSGYSAYVSYDITPAGYTSGAATVTVPVPATFDAGKPVKVLDGDTVLTTTTIKNGTVTFTATHFSVYALGQDAQVALEWKEIPGGIVYQLATDGLTAGTKYLIVNTGADGSGVALRNKGGTEGTTSVTISGGKIVLEEDTDVAWTPNSTTSGHFENQKEYLRLNSSSYDLVTGSSTTLAISNQNNGAYRISATVSGGGWWGSSSNTTYYLAYNSDWESTTTVSNVYLYECKGNGNGGYAAMAGNTVYEVITGTTTKEALKAQIQNNLVVYTATDANGTGAEETTEYTLTGTVDPNTAGTYTYKVTYGGVDLGTITVNVIDKEIETVVLNNNSGTVTKGASAAAETGATLTVNYKDGTFSDPIPVTVGLLTDADGNKVSTSTVGPITGLTVTYTANGKDYTFENFTLTVNPKAGSKYPTYPDPGAVKVNKTATGIDFQASGTATVELSASGIPMNEGVDVVIVLDTSSSMSQYNKYPDENGTEMYRIELLRPAVNNLIQQMKTKREDGSDPDIDIAIVTFNGNTVKADTNEIGGAGSRGTNYGIQTGDGTVTGAWEEISKISSTWATDNSNANTPTGSGTNYDYGLQTAYDLLAQKKADSNSERQQFVLFLSDGSPSQYNGAESNDGADEYVNWIRGWYDNTDTDTRNDIPDIENPEFYTGYNNNNGQLHRSAEAIKAAITDSKDIIRFNSSGVGTLEAVEGLGATVYSIGLLLEDGSARTEEDQITVLKTIASDESKFYNIDSVNDLAGAFSTFATDVLLAATNARFVDEMGEAFDLQLTPISYSPTGGGTSEIINPILEVRSYEIWTRAEYEAGDITDESLIGDRKTNADGTYKYETLETITIKSVTEATSNQLSDANIIKDGVICGKYVFYNTNKKTTDSDGAVMIDVDGDGTAETSLAAECFYWNIGDIRTTEFALRYNVHLEGSLDSNVGCAAGTYETNGDAILYYNNYQELPCEKPAVSPTATWKGASVSYAFYLVDASSGKPVNNDGVEVPFSNRTVIVNPTLYKEVLLNTGATTLEPMTVAAAGVLPAGYWLYDEEAHYTVQANSNETGYWEITGATSGLNNLNSTYVTDYYGDAYTYENSKSTDNPNHEYTHTTVWFAVKWEPQAVNDTVVVDYGLPVDVHVLTNDMFGKYGKLIGVAAGLNHATDEDENTVDDDKKTNDVTTTNAVGKFGTAVLNVPETGYTEANSVIRYTMKDMQMTGADQFTYSIQYANPIATKNDGFYYGTLTVIPATTVYYEDSFVTFTNSSYAANGYGSWTSVTDDTYDATADITQDEDRPDDINYAFDTVIDANNVYGYDSAYENCAQYSLGSAKKVSVKSGISGMASFEFWGTGFDVISMTDTTTGMILVRVFKLNDDGTETQVVNSAVNNYYGYTYQNGKWVAVNSNDPNALYQVPVMKVELDTYAKYRAEIIASYNELSDVTKAGSYDFYLDAIRIYDPANDGATDATIENAYKADNEGWPTYVELRNLVIDEDTFDSLNDEAVSGVVFIDGAASDPDGEVSIKDYTSYGPNNELYLAGGQAVAFDLVATADVASVQLAIKSVGGTGSVKVYGVDDTTTIPAIETDINTATDMYYDITALDGKTVVIQNTGSADDAIISITNIKTTFASAPETDEPMLLMVSRLSARNALATLSVEEEEDIPETTVPEETEPETTVPEETEPEESEPETEETKPSKPGKPNKEEKPNQNKPNQNKPSSVTQVVKTVVTVVKTVVNTVAKALSNLFGSWFK